MEKAEEWLTEGPRPPRACGCMGVGARRRMRVLASRFLSPTRSFALTPLRGAGGGRVKKLVRDRVAGPGRGGKRGVAKTATKQASTSQDSEAAEAGTPSAGGGSGEGQQEEQSEEQQQDPSTPQQPPQE